MTKKKTQSSSGKTIAKLKAKAAKKQEPARQPMIQALVWYKEEHYAQLLTLFDDAELLPQTYQSWLTRAEEKKAEVEANGDQVIKVFIDPETFPEWCEKRNLPKDANSRTQLAIEVAQAGSFSL
jgi:Ulp1 family protease